MTVVVSFDDFTPVIRYDEVPWETVRIEEADSFAGTYTAIDTATLSPVDADPAFPMSRSFTTNLGTAADLWYRVIFVDGVLTESLPSVPLQNTRQPSSSPPSCMSSRRRTRRRSRGC